MRWFRARDDAYSGRLAGVRNRALRWWRIALNTCQPSADGTTELLLWRRAPALARFAELSDADRVEESSRHGEQLNSGSRNEDLSTNCATHIDGCSELCSRTGPRPA